MRPESRRIQEFLLDHGAGQLPHPGGTLYGHLVRVAALLAEWGAGEELQAAGLCHACYGTAGFPHPLLGPDERPVLSAIAGARAESLVYLYGSCDRTAVYPALTEPGQVPFRDRFTGRTHTPPERDIRAFTELTAANELDVIRHSPAMAARHGEALRQFFEDNMAARRRHPREQQASRLLIHARSRHERTLRRAHSPGSAATCTADDEGSADTDPFVRGIRLAWWSTGPGCGPADDSSAPCWSVYGEDRLTGRLTPCGN